MHEHELSIFSWKVIVYNHVNPIAILPKSEMNQNLSFCKTAEANSFDQFKMTDLYFKDGQIVVAKT